MSPVLITLDKPQMHARAIEIVALAEQLASDGVRYRHQGRDPATGLDCAGLLVYVATTLGISNFDTAVYGRRPQKNQFRTILLDAGCIPISRTGVCPGDILRVAAPEWPVHAVIYCGRDSKNIEWMVHAYLPAKQVIRAAVTPEDWRSVREVMRFPEVT